MDERARNAVRGALAADAAALGLHWIYDPARIASVAGDAPEFLAPDLAHYRGTQAYLAHKGKRAGDPTHYGEQLLVMLRSLHATGGRFDAADYERRFVASFGPGGTWVGYIDFPTRETLRRIDAAERTALTAAREFDLGPHKGERSLMEAKVMANVQRWRGEKLARAMEKAVRITHGENRALIRGGQAMAKAVEESRGAVHGADDDQLPAVSKLPALAAYGALDDATVETAVRVTNDNDEAVTWANAVAAALRAACDGAAPKAAAEAAARAADGRLDEALAFDGDALAAAAHFGATCPLPQAVPVLVVLWRDATDFVTAARANILAGGDSAGRAVPLGAVLGAAYGVRGDWVARTRALAEADALLGA